MATADHWTELGWSPDASQQGSFNTLQDLLRQWNSRVNLTRLVEGDDYWVAQVFDSLWPLAAWLQQPAQPLQIIDVGTGGGFPGLAAAIALPAARITLVDSVGRKLEAVRAMANTLGLAERITIRCERVERTGRESSCRGRFDLALARAVAPAPVVAEYLVPLLRPEGLALLYRGHWSGDDQAALDRALETLKAGLKGVERRELPSGRGQRHAVWIEPLAPCPRAYPRAVGLPAKQPLG